MKIYWMFLGLSFLVWFWNSASYEGVRINNQYEKKARWSQAIFFFSVIIFFCGLRSGVADTGTYIHLFETWPSNVADIDWEIVDMDKGFYYLTVLYKQVISNHYQGWLFIIALISGTTTMYALKKYSYNFGFSCFLFIATTTFTYLVNGMRQYICISIVFASIGLIIERKFWKFLALILALSVIHGSVLIFIPVYFLVNVKPWSSTMFLVVIGAAIVGLFFEKIFPMFGSMLAETQYEGYVSYLAEEGVGSSVFRLLIAAVPCVLAFIGRKIVQVEGNAVINIAINMSVLNLCLYFIATFSSGMVVGRVAAYFDIFNIILLPWLIKHIFTKESSQIITVLCVGAYTVFFYLQMVVTWHLNYVSDFLNIHYY